MRSPTPSLPAGGHDVALLVDPGAAGGVSFIGTPSYSTLSANNTLFNEVVGFPSVTATDSGGGADTAALFDAPACRPAAARPRRPAPICWVRAMCCKRRASRRCRSTPRRARSDAGTLADGPGRRHLRGRRQPRQSCSRQPNFSLALYNFASVIAIGSTGVNHKNWGASRTS